ncbi:hypothetical protein [Oenococcus sp.]|uniref:hypothetical protein n=1 Tax=Oenococcus sp. TaxID=1979414 RepID=UPI0039ED4116
MTDDKNYLKSQLFNKGHEDWFLKKDKRGIFYLTNTKEDATLFSQSEIEKLQLACPEVKGYRKVRT